MFRVAKAMNSSDSIKTNDNTTTKKEVVKEENISTNIMVLLFLIKKIKETVLFL